MNPTSVSLLDRLKAARPDDSDWLPAARDLSAADPPLARPRSRPRRRGGRPCPGGSRRGGPRDPPVRAAAGGIVPGLAPAGDGEPRPDPPAATPTQARRRPRPGRRVSSTSSPTRTATSPASGTCDHDRHVVQKLLARRPARLHPDDLGGVPAVRPGRPPRGPRGRRNLGLTENAVIQAKSRILKRLREEAGDLLG